MPERPLLIFPTPVRATPHRRFGGGDDLHLPSPKEQRDRLLPKIQRLEKTFEAARRNIMQDTPKGIQPEKVLVLETVGRIEDFMKAARDLPGLEWLTEWDETDIPPETNVFFDNKHPEKSLGGRLYLLMSNLEGLREFLSLWRQFRDNPEHPAFRRGRGRWRSMFLQLRDIRTWGPEDRVFETGLMEDWDERVAAGQDRSRVEVELWFRGSRALRERSLGGLRASIEQVDGEIISECIIAEIAYHAVLVELPIDQVGAIVHGDDTRLAVADQVMFFRPVGQSAVLRPEGSDVEADAVAAPDTTDAVGEPVIGLLDGLPLENHVALATRLRVDDPDDWAATYEVQRRQHGTAMASLIVNGDLEKPGERYPRPIYVRPIMRPDQRDWRPGAGECIPEDVLPLDLMHRAVRRMVVGEDGAPSAPRVRIINLSIGDPLRQFALAMSPWARLLDYLAWKYRLLFLVSAGNHPTDIVLTVPRGDFDTIVADPARLEVEVAQSLAGDSWNRRLLAPAEAINALTVGATHEDESLIPPYPTRVDPFGTPGMPSPVSAIGPGFRSATKPEVFFPGGRQLYRERPGNTHDTCTLIADRSVLAPGQKVAAPSTRPGVLNALIYTRGTSNATALATRTAGFLYDVLEELRAGEGGDQLDDAHSAIVLKALLVHGARWGDSASRLRACLSTTDKEVLARHLGYGRCEPSRIFSSTQSRATVIGLGSIREGEGHQYMLPLPPSLSGRGDRRTLTVTLAWFSPLNYQHRAYRRAALWFTPYGATKQDGAAQDLLSLSRTETHWQAVRRGTLQHEVFEGERATTFVDGESATIQVNCAADAGHLEVRVPYAIAVSLEVAPGLGIPLYEEIRDRVRPRVGVGVGVAG